MKKKITIAAYLAGVTTLAVSLPAMAGNQDSLDAQKSAGFAQSTLEAQADEKS